MLQSPRLLAISIAFGFVGVSPFAAGAEKTPVILISVDTLRADHLSAYGYTRIRTPNIDSFGDRGTIYEHINAQVPMTLPSHTVLMTSTYPFENRVELNFATLPAGAVTLASVLKANGYRTAAFIGSMILERRTGFVKGFDTYDSPYSLPDSGSVDFTSPSVRRDGTLVLNAARQWIDQNRAQPLFTFIHLYDLHTPYTLPAVKGFLPSVAGYDAELAHVDQALGQLRDALKNDGIWDKALIILVADHGESLGDHGESAHGYFIYESTLHVPLIIHWPAGAAPGPRRSAGFGGLIDVAPTILDYLHIAAPASFRGVSLLSTRERTIYGETIYPQDKFGWAALRSLQSGSYKYIEAPGPELYDLLKDPGERTNVLATHPEQARLLKLELTTMISKSANTRQQGGATNAVPASASTMLRSLGYTSGGRAQQGGSPIDPKDRVREAENYETAGELYSAKQYVKAIALLQQIVSDDPKNFAAAVDLREACASAPTVPACKTQ